MLFYQFYVDFDLYISIKIIAFPYNLTLIFYNTFLDMDTELVLINIYW